MTTSARECLQRAAQQRVLCDTDLRGAELRGVDLRGWTLQRVGLDAADLREARLDECVLESCTLQDARLEQAELERATLLEAYMPWFARVQDFARAPHGSLDDAVQRLDAWFAQARAAAAAQVPEHAELAAYAAAAWADERLQTSRWEHATQWSAHLLQRRHFGVLDAGDGFFRSLQELAPGQQEVREVFVLALLLGLRGRHALDHDDAALAQLREAELRQLPGGPPACAPLLVDAARDPDAAGGATTGHDALRRELRRARLPRRTSWLLAGCAALLPGCVAVVCHLLLRHALQAWPAI